MIFRFVVSNESRIGVTKSRPIHGFPQQGGAGSLKKRGGVKLRYKYNQHLNLFSEHMSIYYKKKLRWRLGMPNFLPRVLGLKLIP
jgi:hypothetical protein